MADEGVVGVRRRRERPARTSVGTGVDDVGGDDQFLIRALSRGLRLLALFTIERPTWSLGQLCERTGLHKATTYRITRTMEAEGFLVFDRETNVYHLGPAAIPLSYLAGSQSELLRLATPFLESLAEDSGETSNLAVENSGAVVVIGQVLTSHPFKPALPIGRVMNGLANAHGKLFIAFLPEVEREALLREGQPRLTEHTITDPSRLRQMLADVARDGLAYDLEEHALGICSVAAPVFDRQGRVRATLAVVAPKERFGLEEMVRHAEAVRKVAAELSEFLNQA